MLVSPETPITSFKYKQKDILYLIFALKHIGGIQNTPNPTER